MKMRIFLLLFTALAARSALLACDVCAANQPAILRGLTHGAGPGGRSDYAIVLLAAVIVAYTLVHAIKCLVRPGERERHHIKRVILSQD